MTSNASQFHVRSGTPADIPFIAWCNYEATSPEPGFSYWDPLLGALNTDTITFIEAIFHADALAWGRPQDFFIIEENGKPIAGASGFVMDTQDYRPLRLERLPDVALRLGWDASTLEQFKHGYESVYNDPHDPTIAPTAPYIIECVAVVPEARGRGVAKQLMKAIFDDAKKRGFTQVGISVTIGNAPAQHVYESVGFEMFMMYGAPYFNYEFPGTIKYRITLS